MMMFRKKSDLNVTTTSSYWKKITHVKADDKNTGVRGWGGGAWTEEKTSTF